MWAIVFQLLFVVSGLLVDEGILFDQVKTTDSVIKTKQGPGLPLQVPTCKLLWRWSSLGAEQQGKPADCLSELLFGERRNTSICQMPKVSDIKDDRDIGLVKWLGWTRDPHTMLPGLARQLIADGVLGALKNRLQSANEIEKSRFHLVIACASHDTRESAEHFQAAYGNDVVFSIASIIAFGNMAFKTGSYPKALELYRSLLPTPNPGGDIVADDDGKYRLVNKHGKNAGWRYQAPSGKRTCTDPLHVRNLPEIDRFKLFDRNEAMDSWRNIQKAYAYYMSVRILIRMGCTRDARQERKRWYPSGTWAARPSRIFRLIDKELSTQHPKPGNPGTAVRNP